MTGVLFRVLLLPLVASLLIGRPHALSNAATQSNQLDQNSDILVPFQGQSISGRTQGILKRQSVLNYTGPFYHAYNFSMPVDHFSVSDNRTYQNRYWVNDTYYQAGGPVIWYDYGEAGVTDLGVNQWIGESNGPTAAMSLARQYHGLVVLWELRYFGLSLPFPINTTNGIYYIREPVGAPTTWQYNTLDQGVEDAAYFATHFNQGDYQRDNMTALLPQNSPWIILGGSFPGVRAANIRTRHPEVFYAAWSSSAPVQAIDDGSTYYDGAELSLHPNCSADVKATVKYADEIMSGTHGSDAYAYLQHLAYAASAVYTSGYNASNALRLRPYDVAGYMATPFGGYFPSRGAKNTTWIFCDAFETFNPNATGSLTNDTYLSIATNPGNAQPSSGGFVATHNNNMTLALQAYFYGYAALAKFNRDLAAAQQDVVIQSAPDGKADYTAWDYIIETQLGWYMGSNPNNISIISKYFNYTYMRRSSLETTFSNATIASFPPSPDVAKWNELGGWRINPTNTMFTDGAWDPWRAGSVFGLETQNGAPGLQPSEEIPACGTHLTEPSVRFGIVYPEAAHVPDLGVIENVYGTGSDTPFERGLALFTKALDAWLPCFGNRTVTATVM